MGLFGKSKKQLLEWQKLVIDNSPDKLVLSEKELEKISLQSAENSMRIIKDSARIINKTVDPATFFSRYELVLQHSEYLRQLTNYSKLKVDNLDYWCQQIQAQKQDEIKNMLKRSWDDVIFKAEKLMTSAAKQKRYTKLYETLEKYDSEMSEENKAYYKNRYSLLNVDELKGN